MDEAPPELYEDRTLDPAWIADEYQRCALDFWYWCDRYAKCRHRNTNLWVPFVPGAAQRKLIETVLIGKWPIGLKVRRLGFTTALMSVAVWLLQLHADYRALAVSAKLEKACELVSWFREVSKQLPEWQQQPEKGRGNIDKVDLVNGSVLRAEAGTESAGRMLGLDLLIVDEARYVHYLRKTLSASEPTLSTTGGVACVVSTGSPGTYFEGLWRASERGTTPYTPIFFGWRAREDMTEADYLEERKKHEHNLNEWLNEFPDNPEESFMSAAGRVFPRFGPDHLYHVEIPPSADLYRSFDFGYSPNHQWVCLWIYHDPTKPPGFSWEPDCDHIYSSPELIDEYAHGHKQMFAFCRKEDPPHNVIERNDDIPDALAYAFAQFDFCGHVHVYRTFSAHSGEQRWEIDDCINHVMRLSGWEPVPNEVNAYYSSPDRERYKGNVADRAATGAYMFMNKVCGQQARDLMAVPYKDIPDTAQKGQKEARFAVVNAFIAGKREPYRVQVLRGTGHPGGNSLDPMVGSGHNIVQALRASPPTRRMG